MSSQVFAQPPADHLRVVLVVDLPLALLIQFCGAITYTFTPIACIRRAG